MKIKDCEQFFDASIVGLLVLADTFCLTYERPFQNHFAFLVSLTFFQSELVHPAEFVVALLAGNVAHDVSSGQHDAVLFLTVVVVEEENNEKENPQRQKKGQWKSYLSLMLSTRLNRYARPVDPVKRLEMISLLLVRKVLQFRQEYTRVPPKWPKYTFPMMQEKKFGGHKTKGCPRQKKVRKKTNGKERLYKHRGRARNDGERERERESDGKNTYTHIYSEQTC